MSRVPAATCVICAAVRPIRRSSSSIEPWYRAKREFAAVTSLFRTGDLANRGFGAVGFRKARRLVDGPNRSPVPIWRASSLAWTYQQREAPVRHVALEDPMSTSSRTSVVEVALSVPTLRITFTKDEPRNCARARSVVFCTMQAEERRLLSAQPFAAFEARGYSRSDFLLRMTPLDIGLSRAKLETVSPRVVRVFAQEAVIDVNQSGQIIVLRCCRESRGHVPARNSTFGYCQPALRPQRSCSHTEGSACADLKARSRASARHDRVNLHCEWIKADNSNSNFGRVGVSCPHAYNSSRTQHG